MELYQSLLKIRRLTACLQYKEGNDNFSSVANTE